jgi:hypothetical protein
MITSEAQLQQVLEQMARMYRALRSIRDREQAERPAWCAVLAEGPIDELRKLQQEVDEYVGLTALREQEADVWVRIHGPEIVWDDAPTSVLTTLLDAFRKVPDPQRRRVLINALKPLIPRKRGAVDFVEIRGTRMPRRGAVRLTRDAHDRLDRALDRLVTERTQTMTGVLFEIDLDASTFLVRESGDAYVVRCSFAEEFYETAKAALDRRVLVSGTVRLREGRRGAPLVYVTRLEILDDDARGG